MLRKILYIHDDSGERDLIIQALQSCEFECLSVCNPSDGITHLITENFDLLLFDIRLECRNGWDTLSQIRSISTGANIPVFAILTKKLNYNELIQYSNELSGLIIEPVIDSEICDGISNFFAWYDPLIKQADHAQIHDVPIYICISWIRLTRQIMVLRQIIEIAISPDQPDTSKQISEYINVRISEIEEIIAKKVQARDLLGSIYPEFYLDF